MGLLQKLKEKARELKSNAIPVYLALFDKRTPLLAKIFAAVTVGYLLSPIDLIPDFIPVLGLLDDLILVPVLIKITISLIPKEIIEDLKTKSEDNEKLQKKWFYALPIILIYVFVVVFFYLKFWK